MSGKIGKILPKRLAKGVDFCGVNDYYYIIRSDLACYMISTNFHLAHDVEVYGLHPACSWGDHYLADVGGHFYIIKGDTYRRVKDMSGDTEASVYPLHPNCQKGDHYMAAFGHFYVIYQSRGVYRKTRSLNGDEDGKEYTLHPDCKDGLYYFGLGDYYYFVKPHDKWGIQYLRSTNLHESLNCETFSFHPTIINFLPGGFGVTKGPAYGEWVCIKTISNDSQTSLEWKNMIIKKTGYEKEKMTSIEHNWHVAANVNVKTGDLTGLIAKAQFSLTTEYGGASVNTERENWSQATEIHESLGVTLKPHQKIYIWTYHLGLGKEPVLYCRDMKILDTSNPPTEVPLPPATN